MKKIIVVIETHNPQAKKTAKEAITAAHSLGSEIIGLTFLDESAVAEFSDFGLAQCLVAKDERLKNYSTTALATVVSQAAKNINADCILFGGNSSAKEIAPRVAVKLNAAYIPDCVELKSDDSTLTAVRPVFAGKAREHVKPKSSTAVITLRPNVFTAKKVGSPAAVITTSFTPQLSDADFSVRTTGVVRNEGKLDVLEADIICSGGRGLKGPEHFHLVESLAATMSAAVGASRAVVDAGWRPHSDQVGQTGKTVSPNLYIACGISGAVQHLAGMSSSKVIAAINKDKDAPIFKVADYGIVGDVFEVLPKLTQKISEITHRH